MHLDSTPDQQSFREQVETFARERVRPQAAEIDESNAYPISLVWDAASRGLLGITIPREHGGLGLDHVSCALAVEAVARASATMAVILVVANALVNGTLRRFGTASQHERWLRPLATGDELGVFALSEDNAGTDAANQETTATADGDGWRLNGRKVWVANLEAARVGVVFAATTPGARGRGITAFLLRLDREGIRKETGPDSLGVRGLGCMDLVLTNVRVDRADVLGEVNGGFAVARAALDEGRIGIAAQALGVGGAALDEAIAHAKTRETFGRPIAKYQAVQWFLADSATELEAARMLTMKAASAADGGEPFGPAAAMAKLAASEAAHRAADRAMQILASAGYSRGSTVERLFRDIRASEIYQGTSEVQRMIIAGAVVAGEI
jgi:butyryl-CoA dehydrogenase